MDSRVTEIFSELGRRLGAYGEGDSCRAARNLAADMLSPEVLVKWLSLYPALPVAVPRNVLIIMAGNIPFVGMHDLLCVLAAGHRAIVKPSSKDFENMSWVVRQQLDISPGLPVALLTDTSPVPDAVIAMGGNDTVAAIDEKYAGIPMLLRGNRSSAAILDGTESHAELIGLADDILSYSGLGCRNVNLVFVPRGYDFSGLRNALSARVGSVGRKLLNNYRQARAMFRMKGVPHIDTGVCLLVEGRDFSEEPGILNYSYYDEMPDVIDWMERHKDEIQCVVASAAAYPASVPPGRAQRPGPADYPDGRDTMQFLTTI